MTEGLLALAFLFAQAAAEKAAEPAAGDLKEAERIIRLHYKAEYSRTKPAELRAFSRTLLTAGRDPMNDAASRYVLFREAREVAVQAGDPRAAIDAIDETAKVFAVDAPGLQKDAVGRIAPPKSADDAHAMADVCLALADEALDAGQFEAASGYAEKAEAAARNAKDTPLLTRATGTLKEAAETLKQYQKVKPLLEKTEDAAASLEVGRFWCFTREDWGAGLPALARGSDEKLKALALRELGKPTLSEQLEIGDAWFELAPSDRGLVRTALLRHALGHYEQGQLAAAGPARVKIDTRIESLHIELAGAMNRTGLVFWVEPGRSGADPFRDLASGSKPTNQGATVSDAGGVKSLAFARTLVHYDVPPAVQAVDKAGSMFAWVKCDTLAQWGGIVDRGYIDKGVDIDDFALFLNQGYVEFWMNWPARRARVGRSKVTVAAGKWTLIGCTWDQARLTFYIDGKEDSSIPLPESPLRRATRVQVGANPPGGTEWYAGLLGSVLIYSRALPPSEAMGLYVGSRPRFR
ncbi:MAG TPA: LamG domain-containing protein [Planctomycetota bacterium]|nr:LamG domain-containing protein [Planctomycetota bacterium]